MPQVNKHIAMICEFCGQEFTVKPSLAKSRRFCSWNCRIESGKQTRTTAICAQCGTTFETYKNSGATYCSISCGMTARNLTDQNPSFHRDISGPNNPMYGKPGLSGPDNPMHGRYKDVCRKTRKDGYVLVKAPDGHPYPSDASGRTTYILEHRLVMEQHLGRYLDPGEVIHHIDGNPGNNSIDNLRLCASQSEHAKEHPELSQLGVSARRQKV